MRICHRCGQRYRGVAHRCASERTGRSKRVNLSPRSEENGDAVVKLAAVANEPLAQMWVEVLGRRGIPCFAKGTGAWSPAIPVLGREHFLYVRAKDLQRAARVLAPYAGRDPALSLEPEVRALVRARRWRPL